MDEKETKSDVLSFQSVLQVDVPKGREGKHKKIITQLLHDLGNLRPGLALKVQLNKLPDSKENIRSALSRAAQQKDIKIATSSNDEYLYIWKTEQPS
jgi:hypothetical protein